MGEGGGLGRGRVQGCFSRLLNSTRFCQLRYVKGRGAFLAKCFWGGLGYQGQKSTHVTENRVFGALVPQFSKNHLAKKPLRDPFE